MIRRFRIVAPASTANLGPGFDTLGMALSRRIDVEVDCECGNFEIELTGEGKESLPRDGSNLIINCAREIAGDIVDRCRWTISSEVPLARGLGSSAAARAVGTAAGYALRDGGLPRREELFQAVAGGEGHGDNAAAAIFGGVRVCAGGEKDHHCWPVPIAVEPEVLLVIPDVLLETSRARAALPASHDLASIVANLQNLALLLSGLGSGNWDAVKRGCHDRIHEPSRLGLIPGLEEALRELRRQPALAGAWLSGAGPALAAFVTDTRGADSAASSALLALEGNGIAAMATTLSINTTGIELKVLA